MKRVYTFLLSITLTYSFAQKSNYQEITPYYLLNLGYSYQNLHYAELGMNVYLVKPGNNIIDIGATVNLDFHEKFVAIPEVQIGYLWNFKESMADPYSKNIKSSFYVSRISVSPWHITPEAGITILSLIDITAGYGFKFRQNKDVNLKGLKLGVSLRVPFQALTFRND